MNLFISFYNKRATKHLDKSRLKERFDMQTMIYDDNKITFLKKVTSNKLRTFR